MSHFTPIAPRSFIIFLSDANCSCRKGALRGNSFQSPMQHYCFPGVFRLHMRATTAVRAEPYTDGKNANKIMNSTESEPLDEDMRSFPLEHY